MSAIYQLTTKSGTRVKLYQQSIVINNVVIFNGSSFCKNDIQNIKDLLDAEFKEGQEDKVKQLRKVLLLDHQDL
ncbi:MAG: hypothetical protein GY853_15680 [PVC group bacterium]|nr:hypothetical protein [PVC group bacterium]